MIYFDENYTNELLETTKFPNTHTKSSTHCK